MYNLDVLGNDNFFVGSSSWLVHNANNSSLFKFQSGTGMAANFDTTGFHLNMGKKEVQVNFRRGELTAIIKGGGNLGSTELTQLKQFLNENKGEVRRQLQMGLQITDRLENTTGKLMGDRYIDDANRFRNERRDLKYFLKNGCL